MTAELEKKVATLEALVAATRRGARLQGERLRELEAGAVAIEVAALRRAAYTVGLKAAHATPGSKLALEDAANHIRHLADCAAKGQT